jgi:hypothetical protein
LGVPNGEGIRRCRKHTEALVEELELGVLWDEYGLVGDVVVNQFLFLPFLFLFPLFVFVGAPVPLVPGLFIPVADTRTLHGFVSCSLRYVVCIANTFSCLGTDP